MTIAHHAILDTGREKPSRAWASSTVRSQDGCPWVGSSQVAYYATLLSFEDKLELKQGRFLLLTHVNSTTNGFSSNCCYSVGGDSAGLR